MEKSGKRSSKSERLDFTTYFAMSFLVDVSMVKISIQTNACGVRVIIGVIDERLHIHSSMCLCV